MTTKRGNSRRERILFQIGTRRRGYPEGKESKSGLNCSSKSTSDETDIALGSGRLSGGGETL